MCMELEKLFGSYSPEFGLQREEDPLSGEEELGLRPNSWLDSQRDQLKRGGSFALRGGLLGMARKAFGE